MAIACPKATVYGLDCLPATIPILSNTDRIIDIALEGVNKPSQHYRLPLLQIPFVRYDPGNQ